MADTVSAATAAVTGGAAKPQPMTRQQVDEQIARKQLAQELGYTGALDGSAEMNVWLHKQVMAKLMESGGVVPESLK